MSNLSDIGFPVKSEQDVNQVIMDVMPHLVQIPSPPRGYYYKFSDESGAELYLQGNTGQDILGFNPAFNGKSSIKVGLTTAIERDTSELDGAFKGWVNPADINDPETTSDYPIVFDMPDFRLHENMGVQTIVNIQLAAFASNDFEMFESKDAFEQSQEGDPKFSSLSFIPSGLFRITESGETEDVIPPQAHAIFSGEIKEAELRTNSLTGAKFYWLLVNTFGGDIDVVADQNLLETRPKIGGIVKGSFWLSGKILG